MGVTGEVAIAHKDYAVRGGGERLAETLAQAFDAPLYYGGKHEDVALDYDDTRLIEMTSRQRWAAQHGGLPRALAYLAGWESETRLAEYDTVITSGNEPLWYVPEPEQTLVAYCHSPPRVLYDLNHNTGRGTLGALLRAVKRALNYPTTLRPDYWIANSDHVARRLRLYYNIPRDQLSVVYPPVDIDAFQPDATRTGDYYLYLGRLAGHKRVEYAVDAATQLGRRLVVAGRGPERATLADRAGPTVDLRGYVGEAEKRELLAGARAILMPAQREDFGIVPVEALASGTPVIGVPEGMTQYQILDGRNGVLVDDASPQGFAAGIRAFERDGVAWTPGQMRAFARANFSRDAFEAGIREAVAAARERASTASTVTIPAACNDSQADGSTTDIEA